MARKASSLVVALALLGLLPVTASGQIPLQVNHQGLVKVNTVAFAGDGDFRFALVDPDTGTNLWTNDGTQVPGSGTPTGAVNLLVINGIYNVRLGDTSLTNMTAISSTVFNDDNVALRIWFDDGANGVEQLAPDHVLTAAPYAFRAATATIASDADTVDGQHADEFAATDHSHAGGAPDYDSGWFAVGPTDSQEYPVNHGLGDYPSRVSVMIKGSTTSGTPTGGNPVVAPANVNVGMTNAGTSVHCTPIQIVISKRNNWTRVWASGDGKAIVSGEARIFAWR